MGGDEEGSIIFSRHVILELDGNGKTDLPHSELSYHIDFP